MRKFNTTLFLSFFLVMSFSAFAQEDSQSGEAGQAKQENSTSNELLSEDEGVVSSVEDGAEDESGISFSDLAIDELSKSGLSGQRNPFVPGVVQEEFDPSSLIVEGIIITPLKRIALVSGQTIEEGERVGNYTVKSIQPQRIILKQLEDEFYLKALNYQIQVDEKQDYQNYIYFHNAGLRESLVMLARVDDINMIIPQGVGGKVSVTFRDTDLTDVMGSILRVNNLEYATENNIIRIGPVEQFIDGSDLKTLAVPLKYAIAEDAKDVLDEFISKRGSITHDERTNMVMIKDNASILDGIQKIIAGIDIKDMQVSIEAKIIDASTSFSRAIGIRWGFVSGSSRIVGRGNVTDSTLPNSTIDLSVTGATSGFDLLLGRLPGNLNLQTSLSAAESTGAIRIISKPNVTTINNKTARISSGITLNTKVDGGADSGPTLQEITTGIELQVTPQITINRMVKMEITAVESEADFSRTVDGIPAILNNEATTTVLVPDGETAVIGGLMKVRSSKEYKKVPFLGDIPILGWLFKNQTKTKDNNELMIFITPRILDTDHFRLMKGDQSVPVSPEKT